MNTHLCGEHAPGDGATNRCDRHLHHKGIHATYGAKGLPTDTWPRWQDVVALKRENGTL